MIKQVILFITLFISLNVFSQEKDSLKITKVDSIALKKALKKQARIERREARELKNVKPYNPLAPTKAAFYSAILPGLGQAYTGKYWKIPIVYGALGTGIGIALWNQRNFDEVRGNFKNRLLGINTGRFNAVDADGEFIIPDESLVSAFENSESQRDLAILITVGIYVLNIIDANVTAHLQQYNLDKDLTITPQIKFDDFTTGPNYGLSLNYSFH